MEVKVCILNMLWKASLEIVVFERIRSSSREILRRH